MQKQLGQVTYEAWHKRQHPQAVHGGWPQLFDRERSIWAAVERDVLKHYSIEAAETLSLSEIQ